MVQEITFEVTDLHAEMLEEAREIAGEQVDDSALYPQPLQTSEASRRTTADGVRS